MNVFDSLKIDPCGCNLIEASAGTGKTYAITSLYVRLIIENEQYRPENILVVTFTEAATKELRDRIRRRLREARDAATADVTADPFLAELMSSEHREWPGGEAARARLELALQTFDGATISTIHSFCSRALQENAFESGSLFDTELVKNQKQLISQIVDDFWRVAFFAPDSQLLPLAIHHKWSPELFTAFLKGLLTNPVLKIVPVFTKDEIEQIRSDCSHVYHRISEVWAAQRGEIEQILLEHKGLSRNQDHYRRDVLPEVLDGMDCYAGQGTPYAVFGGYEKLTSSYMKNHRLKKVDPPEHQFFTLWDELATLLRRVVVSLRAELIEYAKKCLRERKSALNIRFFDDLMTDLHHALGGAGGEILAERMRGKYRAALIDEFQDTDQIQYKIFNRLFMDGKAPLFLIGDPKQAIYSFRGADIYAYLEAKKGISEKHHHTMTLNWRSSENLVKAVNRMFSLNKLYPLVIEDLTYPEVKVPEKTAEETTELTVEGRDPSPMQIWFYTRQAGENKSIPVKRAHPDIVKSVTDEIAALLRDASELKATIGDRAIVPSDIAVIVRGHKQAKMIYDSLQQRGIPAVVRSEQSIFRTQEAIQFCTILNAVAEAGREGKVRGALATDIMGVSANDIARTFEPDGATDWEKRLNSFKEYHEEWKNRGFIAMFRHFIEAEGVRARLLSMPGGERSLTNLLHAGELLHNEASAGNLGVNALSTWFSEQVAAPPENEEHQIRLESDDRAVKILTIHVSKGLEFPIVFCPFLWGGVYDSNETVLAHEGYELVADFGSDKYPEHHRASLDEGLAENVRLLYVALTRAKFRCYMAWGRFKYSESSAAAYLFHAPEKVAGSSQYEALTKVMNTLDDNTMIDKIRSIAADGLIHLTINPALECTSVMPDGGDEEQFHCRTMVKAVASDWRVASFSSLIAGHDSPPELPDYDSSEETSQVSIAPSPDENSFFSFPPGPEHGSFLHAIFEKVDFASADERELKELIQKATDRSPKYVKYSGIIHMMLTSVLNADLLDGLTLSSLQPGNWVQEMQFYFPLNSIDPKLLAGFFKGYGITSPVNLERVAESLNFQNVRGMLLGFIDLLFCHDGKYYILDWKSNHLGYQPDDYTPASLARDMERKLYPLQYLIYTVAVNRFLERRIPEYRYETHFGGALYLYLRGIDNSRPGNGIYFDKPDAALVMGLTRCLIDFEGV